LRLEWGTIVKTVNLTFVFSLLNFALLVWLLKRIVYKRALGWLDARRELEQKRVATARELEARAQALVQESEQKLAQANHQAQRILEEAQAQAQAILRQAREEARAQAQRIVREAEEAAARAKEEALAELKRAYAELVILGARQVLAREVRPEDHLRLLSELAGQLDTRLLS
jgi:F-type H+-transporting ATPase subunit b